MDTLWLIEDDKVQQFIVKKLVAQTPIVNKLLCYENGEDAYNALLHCLNNGESFPQLILLDINMPVLDAWGFLNKVSELNNSIVNAVPVIIFTSSAHGNDLEQAGAFSNIKGYLVKPCTAESLKECIKKLGQIQQ